MDDLIGHLELEFKYGTEPNTDYFLNESHGYVSNLYEILSEIDIALCNKVDFSKSGMQQTTITEKDFNRSTLEKMFFDKVSIILIIEIAYRKTSEIGGLDVDSIETRNGNVSFDIYARITGYGREDILNSVNRTVGHELLHAYTEISRRNAGVKFNREKYRQVTKSATNSTTALKKNLATILYYIDPDERKAYIGQCMAELMDKKNEIKNSETAERVIRETDTWKKFEQTCKAYESFYYLTPSEKNNMVNYFNEITALSIKTFQKVMSVLHKGLTRFNEEFEKQIPKMAYDAYCKREEVTFMFEDFKRLFLED
jgi:uncharacterized protein (UPF0305 family)